MKRKYDATVVIKPDAWSTSYFAPKGPNKKEVRSLLKCELKPYFDRVTPREVSLPWPGDNEIVATLTVTIAEDELGKFPNKKTITEWIREGVYSCFGGCKVVKVHQWPNMKPGYY